MTDAADRLTDPATGLAALTGVLIPGRRWRNWGRTVDVRPDFVARPASVDEVVAVVRYAALTGQSVKPVGAGHSFSPIAATTGIQIDLSRLAGLEAVDTATGRVRFGAGTHLWQVPELLAPYGLAMQNLGDIDRQTIAGATSTGTHGTGAGFGGLATQITALSLVTGTGEVVEIGDGGRADLLPAARIGLGALGVVVSVEVQCVPAFQLRAVEQPEQVDAVLDGLAERLAADHFEFYWWPHTDVAMTKTNTRLPLDAPSAPVGRLAGLLEDRLLANGGHLLACEIGHALPTAIPAINRLATRAYGHRTYTDVSTRVFTHPRTTRFRELEYALPREALREALAALRTAMARFTVSFPVEVRFAAADDVWLSTASGRDTAYIAVHRYWRDDAAALLHEAEAVLRGFDGRPHWGKIHWRSADDLRPAYPRFDEFVAVRDELDPDRRFANRYLERVLGA